MRLMPLSCNLICLPRVRSDCLPLSLIHIWTKEALKWAFAAKPGEVSGLYECGESDRMLVVGLVSVIEEGYRPLAQVQDQLRAEIIRDKKAEKIMADMKAANATTIAQYTSMANAVSDSVKHVTFAAPAYVLGLSLIHI